VRARIKRGGLNKKRGASYIFFEEVVGKIQLQPLKGPLRNLLSFREERIWRNLKDGEKKFFPRGRMNLLKKRLKG